MSQYVKLGTQCESQTMTALTSNAKYIIPLSSVYYNKLTPMLYYPGMENMYGMDATKFIGKGKEPEKVKAYQINNSLPETHIHSVSNIDVSSQDFPEQQNPESCHMCKNWN